MADDRHYVPGSFYRICDRTGFKVRAERTRKEWDGLQVRDQSWEMRHPQDFVRGRKDPQTVPDARPRQQNQFITPNFRYLTSPFDPTSPNISRIRYTMDGIPRLWV